MADLDIFRFDLRCETMRRDFNALLERANWDQNFYNDHRVETGAL